MMFSLLHPSRSRPKKSRATIKKWIDNAQTMDFEVIVSCDYDDPDTAAYDGNYNFPNTRQIWMHNKSAVQAINNAAKISTGNILIVVSDDTDCPMYWDKILRDAIAGHEDFVMKVHDGLQKRIITMPIMDRIYYKRDNFIYDPDFRHSWADTYLTELAHFRKRVINRLDINFKHLHPDVTHEEKDDLYLRNDKTHDADRYIYQNKIMQLNRTRI